MDSYTRDSSRASPDRSWSARDDSRNNDRDSFYRGRSPGVDRVRRSGRSRSPAPRDRYEPRSRARDDYGNGRDRDRDDRRRIGSPPANIDRYVPGHQTHAPPPAVISDNVGLAVPLPGVRPGAASALPLMVNPIPDPLNLPYQVGFSYFGEWWRTNEKVKDEKERLRTGRRREPERPRGAKEAQEEREREKEKIQAAYDAYKEEVQAKMAQAFVKQHKDEAWFRERYIPEVRDPFRRQLAEFRKSTFAQWEQDLRAGLFDEFSLEGVHKTDNNGSMADKEEGEATAGNDTFGVGDLVPASSAVELRDEILYRPTLLIKTIAPSVSRQNLEAFCLEHLGDGEGGLRWLSLSDPNPTKRFHRIGWIMLNPGPEGGYSAPSQNEDGDIDVTSPVTASVAERALEAVNGKTVKDEARGDFVCHVGIHSPSTNTRRKALWDLFSAPERIEKDLSLVQRLVGKFEAEINSNFNAISRVEEKVEELKNTGRLHSFGPSSSERNRRSAPAKRKAKKSREFAMDVADDDFGFQADEDADMEDDEEREEGEEEEEGAVDEEVDDEELLAKKKQLDLLIEYLRRVFGFCFFCVFESDSAHELMRKCPGGHLRRPRSTLTEFAKEVARASANGEPFPTKRRGQRGEPGDAEEGELPQEGNNERKFRAGAAAKPEQQLLRAYNWVRTFEEKILQLLEPGSVDLRKYGGKPIEEALNEELAKHVKQEDDHKFRCRLPECTKLFKEEHFWRKHIEKRHAEWYDALRAEFELVNAYVSDPSHIVPSRTDTGNTGHFASSNGHLPTGTPRGFSLQSLQSYSPMGAGLPPVPGFTPPAGFNPYNPVAMQMPGSWQAPGSIVGVPSDYRGGAGPIRRGGTSNGGSRYNNNRSGPYDRRPMRWNQETGLTGGPPGYHNSGGFSSMRNGGARPGSLATSSGTVAGAGNSGSGSGGVPGGRWGDGGGGATASPHEAVQGRTIKSYEDLDQVPGAGGGELNY